MFEGTNTYGVVLLRCRFRKNILLGKREKQVVSDKVSDYVMNISWRIERIGKIDKASSCIV